MFNMTEITTCSRYFLFWRTVEVWNYGLHSFEMMELETKWCV
jgi:hypothetical protein